MLSSSTITFAVMVFNRPHSFTSIMSQPSRRNILLSYRSYNHFFISQNDNFVIYINEPPHDKTNKMTCAHSEDSDQPGLPPSLIRVFAVRMKKAWVLSYPLSAQRRLLSAWASAGLSFILLVLSWGGSFLVHMYVSTHNLMERIIECQLTISTCPCKPQRLVYFVSGYIVTCECKTWRSSKNSRRN